MNDENTPDDEPGRTDHVAAQEQKDEETGRILSFVNRQMLERAARSPDAGLENFERVIPEFRRRMLAEFENSLNMIVGYIEATPPRGTVRETLNPQPLAAMAG